MKWFILGVLIISLGLVFKALGLEWVPRVLWVMIIVIVISAWVYSTGPTSSGTTDNEKGSERRASDASGNRVNRYLKAHHWSHLLVGALIINVCIWMLAPITWEEKMLTWPTGGYILLIYLFFFWGINILPEAKEKPWKYRVAYIVIAFCLLVFLNKIGALPIVGEDYWKSGHGNTFTSGSGFTGSNQVTQSRIIVAPAPPMWSERIRPREGQTIIPHGPILIMNEKGETIEDNADGKMKNPFYSKWFMVQSRTNQVTDVRVDY